MARAGSSFFTLPDRRLLSQEGPEPGPIVVWLWGEHDLSTDSLLCLTLARAIACDSAGLVLDLSEVEIMAASTLGVIVRAREFLRQRFRSLTVRAPSARVRRVIDEFGCDDLLGPSPGTAPGLTGKALRSWVEVPVAQRCDGQPARSQPVPELVPAGVGRTIDLGAEATSPERSAESE